MGGEICAFVDSFDAAFGMAADLELVYGRKLRIDMLTDSKQLFDAMVKGKKTSKMRLMVDIMVDRQS